MLTVRRVRKEERIRDRFRNRLVLTIGDLTFRITRKEALSLKNQLNRFNLQQ